MTSGRKCQPTRRPPGLHPLLHEFGINNGKPQYCRRDGDIDPEFDDVALQNKVAASRFMNRLNGGLQSDRHWMIKRLETL
jgi:hypothetical protein